MEPAIDKPLMESGAVARIGPGLRTTSGALPHNPPVSRQTMDLNRNQFFFMGLLVLLIGVQVRYVSAYVLNPEATRFLAERTGQATPAGGGVMALADGLGAGPRKVLEPPEWLSWCLMSCGAVLVLHSLAMPKPG
jgi:hypothetical protein